MMVTVIASSPAMRRRTSTLSSPHELDPETEDGMSDQHEPNEQAPAPRDDVYMERSASSLIFQSLDAVGDVGLGTGTALLGAAAWKAAGSKAPEQEIAPPQPPAPPSSQKTD